MGSGRIEIKYQFSGGGLEACDELLDEHPMELDRRSAITELLQAAQRGSAGHISE